MKFVSSEGTVTSSPARTDAQTWHDPDPEAHESSLDFVPAGAVQRGTAFAIDAMILFVLHLILGFLFMFIGVADLFAETHRGAVALFGRLALFVGDLGYFTWFHATAGATPGMRLMGIGLMTRSGGAVGTGTALARNAAFLFLPTAVGLVAAAFRVGEMATLTLEGAALLPLALPVLFTAERMALHDGLARTRVKDLPASSDQARTRGGNSV